MKSGPVARRGWVGLLGLGASLGVVVALPPLAGASLPSSGQAAPAKVALRGELPTIPADVAREGAVPGSRMVHLLVSLAGQDPTGLANEVVAVSTPGSPRYRHYLTSAQFAAAYGPSPAEQQQVAGALRDEGLTVGNAADGSTLLPVSGTAATVSAAFGTPLESVVLPGQVASMVNTAEPQIPASVDQDITGVAGLDGLALAHSMLRRGTASGPVATATPHVVGSGPQACAAATNAARATAYTSTQLAGDYGLSQLFAQGRTGIGETIAVVEFEQYSSTDIATFESCYGLSNPVRTVVVDGSPGGPPGGSGEAALDIEAAAVNAPSADVVVYEAPNDASGASSLDVLNRIASDDVAQTVTTSWGICEQDNNAGDGSAESAIFARMAAQGQTMVAAAGDSGSEDCYDTDGGTELSVDDPGSQPDVVSAGGTTLVGGAVASQTAWNNCGRVDANSCQTNEANGAGGGGYSALWPRPTWQPALGATTSADPCGGSTGCRSVPDLAADADPSHGVVAYYGGGGGWTIFGGTSAVAPLAAALFADTDQGCAAPLGLVGPALYAANDSADYSDVTTGNNDFTGTQGGLWPAGSGYDTASGLGTPVAQNLAIALQGGDGCPSVAGLSTHSGPVGPGAAITITGGGLADASAVNFGAAGAGQIVSATETSLTVVPPSPTSATCVDVTVTNPRGVSATSAADRYAFGGNGNCSGYRFVASDGGIFDFGSAAFEGSTGNLRLNSPVVGMATTPSGNGYWLVARDGGIFTFGDARFFGSTGNIHLNQPIVGLAATPGGNGYWLVAADGGIFTFGAAAYFGSTGNLNLTAPIVGMAATPDGGGYWLVSSGGGVFAFGDAAFHGSAGNVALAAPIVGMAATPNGGGYWLVASDGGIFACGNAGYYGSAGNIHLNRPIVGMAATPDGGGYWLVASDGGIFSFGDAPFSGSTGNIRLNRPIVGMASA